jgi:hypothetical protein
LTKHRNPSLAAAFGKKFPTFTEYDISIIIFKQYRQVRLRNGKEKGRRVNKGMNYFISFKRKRKKERKKEKEKENTHVIVIFI